MGLSYPHSQTAKYSAILEHGTDGDGEKESRKYPLVQLPYLLTYLKTWNLCKTTFIVAHVFQSHHLLFDIKHGKGLQILLI